MWNKKSILWELEYWPMLDVRHSIDNMHVKKNVCEATCGTLLQQKSKGNDVSIEDVKHVREMLCAYILKETIDRKGNFYSGTP
jgi:hypothetical protein